MGKKTIITDNKFANSIIIGALLKAQREHIDISQKDIADRLGYRNYNYISMLERGNSTISIGKVSDIIKAYELPADFALVIVKGLWPEVYDILFQTANMVVGQTPATVDAMIADMVSKMVKDYGVKFTKDQPKAAKAYDVPGSSVAALQTS